MLFDEVFKGTNVKGALDSSAEVISGLGKAARSGFLFSSHLVELGEVLRDVDGIQLRYFDGELHGDEPHSTDRRRAPRDGRPAPSAHTTGGDVMNAGPDRAASWSPNLDYRLGGQPSGPESFYQLYPRYVSVSPAGTIGVVNRRAFQASVFGPDGTLVRTSRSRPSRR